MYIALHRIKYLIGKIIKIPSPLLSKLYFSGPGTLTQCISADLTNNDVSDRGTLWDATDLLFTNRIR